MARLRTAIQSGDLAAFGAVLDDNVRWGGEADTPETPLNEPFGVREMHVRHPDGHVFRISQPVHSH